MISATLSIYIFMNGCQWPPQVAVRITDKNDSSLAATVSTNVSSEFFQKFICNNFTVPANFCVLKSPQHK